MTEGAEFRITGIHHVSRLTATLTPDTKRASLEPSPGHSRSDLTTQPDETARTADANPREARHEQSWRSIHCSKAR